MYFVKRVGADHRLSILFTIRSELGLQWWIDTREFSAPDSPPRRDMWEDWEI